MHNEFVKYYLYCIAWYIVDLVLGTEWKHFIFPKFDLQHPCQKGVSWNASVISALDQSDPYSLLSSQSGESSKFQVCWKII